MFKREEFTCELIALTLFKIRSPYQTCRLLTNAQRSVWSVTSEEHETDCQFRLDINKGASPRLKNIST